MHPTTILFLWAAVAILAGVSYLVYDSRKRRRRASEEERKRFEEELDGK